MPSLLPCGESWFPFMRIPCLQGAENCTNRSEPPPTSPGRISYLIPSGQSVHLVKEIGIRITSLMATYECFGSCWWCSWPLVANQTRTKLVGSVEQVCGGGLNVTTWIFLLENSCWWIIKLEISQSLSLSQRGLPLLTHNKTRVLALKNYPKHHFWTKPTRKPTHTRLLWSVPPSYRSCSSLSLSTKRIQFGNGLCLLFSLSWQSTLEKILRYFGFFRPPTLLHHHQMWCASQ